MNLLLKLILSIITAAPTVSIAGWLGAEVFFNVFRNYLRELNIIENVQSNTIKEDILQFNFVYFISLFVFLITVITITLLISKIHECWHKYVVHNKALYDDKVYDERLHCAYNEL